MASIRCYGGLVTICMVVIIALLMINSVHAWTRGGISHEAMTEQVRAHYKQYLLDLETTAATNGNSDSSSDSEAVDAAADILVAADIVGDTRTCSNITGPIAWVTPQDLSAHHHLVEYWFYLGLITDSKTNTSYGMDFTVWRFATQCPDPTAVAWYIYLGIADEKANTYYSGVQSMWGPFVTTNKGNTSMNLAGPDGKFSVKQDPNNLSMFTLSSWVPQYPSTTQRMNITLKLASINGDQAMADNGFSSPILGGHLGAAQYEASRLQVKGGEFAINGATHTFDRGDVYLQHMWESTTDSMPDDPNSGWDWAWGILDNGWSYSLTHWRQSMGVYLNHSYINVIRPRHDGKLENIYLLADAWTRTEFGPVWTSPHTNITYTLGHRLTVPSLGLIIDSVPLIHDNEVNWNHPNQLRYYEGIGRVNGTVNGVVVKGSGGTEFVGIGGMHS